MGETGGFRCQRPEEVHHAMGQATGCNQVNLAQRPQGRILQGLLVGCPQRPLWSKNQDGIGPDSTGKQLTQVLHSDGGLATAGGAAQVSPGAGGGFEDVELITGKIHFSRLAERVGFVNQ